MADVFTFRRYELRVRRWRECETNGSREEIGTEAVCETSKTSKTGMVSIVVRRWTTVFIRQVSQKRLCSTNHICEGPWLVYKMKTTQ